MLDLFHIPEAALGDVQVFGPNSLGSGVGWTVWNKRRGVSMVYILCIGAGGWGGSGAVGAASTAAGGGGGGSGAQTTVLIPAFLLPDTLFVSVGASLSTNGVQSKVSIYPDTSANNAIAVAGGGGSGGNASGATAGTAGAAGAIGTIATCVLAGLGQWNFLAGQAGIVGGTTGNGGALTQPVTGLMVTGGTGGGGLPALSTVGGNGGAITGVGQFPTINGGGGGAASNAPGDAGSHGGIPVAKLGYRRGGTGGGGGGLGASGNATAAGGIGGAGAPGCGGGGGGGGFTGAATAVGGRGGDGIVIIAAW